MINNNQPGIDVNDLKVKIQPAPSQLLMKFDAIVIVSNSIQPTLDQQSLPHPAARLVFLEPPPSAHGVSSCVFEPVDNPFSTTSLSVSPSQAPSDAGPSIRDMR